MLSGERALTPERDSSLPKMDTCSRRDESPSEGSLSPQRVPPHCRGASDHEPGFDACYKPDESNPSQRDSFKAVSVSSKDDPAQSFIPPCAVSFCLLSF